MIETKEAIELLLATGRAQQPINDNEGGNPFLVTPTGEVKDLSKVFAPRRVEQTVNLLDAESFCDYVNKFKTSETVIFANVQEDTAKFQAVLDYHAPSEDGAHPDYCRHQAWFTTIQTPEWKTWLAANRKSMSQVEFAAWLEDNAKLLVHPDGGELLELVRTLHGHQNARFNTALRLNTGAYSVSYDEDVEIKGTIATKPGSIDLPPEIVAGIRLFQGGEAYEVRARLKSRCAERRLALHFETISLPALVRDSLLAVVKQIAEKTSIKPWIGSPV